MRVSEGQLRRGRAADCGLLQRAASKLDQAAVYHLKVLIQTVKSENVQAVATALVWLRLFGIDLPAHPTWEQVEAEYETVR